VRFLTLFDSPKLVYFLLLTVWDKVDEDFRDFIDLGEDVFGRTDRVPESLNLFPDL
jgi:hypothetical protein